MDKHRSGRKAQVYPKQPLLQLNPVWLILIGLLVIIIALQSVAVYMVFTSKFAGANDFFVRWLGGREYLLHGTNPYDQSVAEQAQRAMFGRLTTPEDKDEAYFAYPLYTLYFFWPLSLLPYAWAQAIWMTVLQFMLLGVTVLSIRLAGWSPPKWLFWLTLFWGIFFYNGARSIILGQFSVLVGLALLVGLWAIESRRDLLAGICLAITTIKPQMVVLVIIFLLIWALFQLRWRIVLSFGLSLVTLVLSSMLLVPTWPIDFVRNAIAYSDYVAFGTPLENLLHFLLPDSLATPLTMLLSLLFFLTLLPGWWLAFKGRPGAYTWAIMSTLIVGSLIAFRSATTNQIILYLPLFFFFQRLTGPQRALTAAIIEGLLLVIMWGAFIVTLAGDWEHIMLHGLLPALVLILYAADWHHLWQSAQTYEYRHWRLQPRQAL
ncbi:MAG: DUF2029 domain-containing protein [Anaerolineae bacterium]|nr:DUF2029 domain-containing protein [Anaerolineae bacterium]